MLGDREFGGRRGERDHNPNEFGPPIWATTLVPIDVPKWAGMQTRNKKKGNHGIPEIGIYKKKHNLSGAGGHQMPYKALG